MNDEMMRDRGSGGHTSRGREFAGESGDRGGLVIGDLGLKIREIGGCAGIMPLHECDIETYEYNHSHERDSGTDFGAGGGRRGHGAGGGVAGGGVAGGRVGAGDGLRIAV